MPKYLVDSTQLQNIATAIKNKIQDQSSMTINEMPNKIASIETGASIKLKRDKKITYSINNNILSFTTKENISQIISILVEKNNDYANNLALEHVEEFFCGFNDNKMRGYVKEYENNSNFVNPSIEILLDSTNYIIFSNDTVSINSPAIQGWYPNDQEDNEAYNIYITYIPSSN